MSALDNIDEPSERYTASLIMIGGITTLVTILADLAEDFDAEDFEALREGENAEKLLDFLDSKLLDIYEWAEGAMGAIENVRDLLDEEAAA